jgi:hypothetical protein
LRLRERKALFKALFIKREETLVGSMSKWVFIIVGSPNFTNGLLFVIKIVGPITT